MIRVAPAGGSGKLPPAPKAAPVKVAPVRYGGAQALNAPAARPSPAKALGSALGATTGHTQAVVDVFHHQSPAHQATILKGVQAGKADPVTAEAVKLAVKSMDAPSKQALAQHLLSTSGSGINHLIDELNPAKLFTSGLKGNAGTAPGSIPGSAAIQGGVQSYAKIGSLLTRNALKDAVDLPAETFSTAGTLGKDIVTGHPGKAVSDVVSPYKQLVEHPGQTILNHPLDTYLMATAPLHGVTRLGAGAVRAAAPDSTLGQALATSREGVQLGGKLTSERPRSSPYPLIQAGQKLVEKAKYDRAPTGELVPRSPTLRAKLTGMETSRQVGVNERIRTANRDLTISRRVRAITPGLASKVAHGARSALKYNPDRAVIPGAEVLSRIADATIRKPSTYIQDLEKHIRQVAATRPDLVGSPKLLKEHDAYINTLTKAAQRNLSPADLAKVFKAADAYAEDYHPVQSEAHKLGQFGDRTPDALLKRQLYHYAQTHMGAHVDPELGLVDEHGAPLGTSTIMAHLKGPEGTDGRVPAFTSDKPKAGSAFYVSSERRPLPQNASNTGFAFTHGLTDPGHNALLEQHVRMQGIVDSHKAQNRLVSTNTVMKPDGTAWPSYGKALKDAPPGYVPIALSQPFHPLDSLGKALEGTDPNDLEREAQTHSLDLNARLNDSGQGRWGLVDETVLKRLNEHTGQITSNAAMRGFKMANNQFRQVALGTSPKHIPGVISEGIIRSVASGEGIGSWITGRRLINRAEQLNPDLGRQGHIQITGGGVAGSTKTMMTRQVSDHFHGTNLEGPLKGFEALMRAPGPRQLRTAWKAWLKLAINGTKKYVEEQNQTASLGKAALRDFGSEHGPVFKAMRLQGAMLDDAAKGLFDPVKLRQFRAEIERVRGRWTDLTPTGQTAMMLSPFGLWWTNSVKWLARSPIDRPVQSGALAAATVGTQKDRSAQGLDLFSPNAAPGYMQGGIPLGGNKILAQNYYSPFGVANDPLATFGSLAAPTLQAAIYGAAGDNYLGKALTSPDNPHGDKAANPGMRLRYILNSGLGLFIPLYSKAETIAQGGASAYDSSTLAQPETKTPGTGLGAGVEKALTPYRLYHNNPPAASGSSSKVVIPGHGSTAGVVIPGHGSTDNVVIP
jgi:hypothetical protein